MDAKGYDQKKKEFEVGFFKEGHGWAAAFNDFTSRHESPTGFGNTPEEAFADLMREKQKEHYLEEVKSGH
ncbi:hypothetical protein [Dawidia soli]|uniref:Uncharacterized protein n=1 Tax=Dawidia soli TaxID=2782352 RepID=A0AAP2D5T3_9BACT|nr:hypothetical protein [Dawidia soli]MBT1685918.1 hypothetical protein [Dawidia soli]